jgi:hypothetical protein
MPEPINAEDLARRDRVAEKLGLTFQYVRSVVRGIRHSEAVLTALREDKNDAVAVLQRYCDDCRIGSIGVGCNCSC